MRKQLSVTLHVCSVRSDFFDPMDCSRQAPLAREFSGQEYWSELLFPPPRDLPDPGTKSVSLESPALVDGFLTAEPLGKPSL